MDFLWSYKLIELRKLKTVSATAPLNNARSFISGISSD